MPNGDFCIVTPEHVSVLQGIQFTLNSSTRNNYEKLEQLYNILETMGLIQDLGLPGFSHYLNGLYSNKYVLVVPFNIFVIFREFNNIFRYLLR